MSSTKISRLAEKIFKSLLAVMLSFSIIDSQFIMVLRAETTETETTPVPSEDTPTETPQEPESTPEITADPQVTPSPETTAMPNPDPTEEPIITPEVTDTPQPTDSVLPTETPSATPAVTPTPSETPAVTIPPISRAEAQAGCEAIGAPGMTVTWSYSNASGSNGVPISDNTVLVSKGSEVMLDVVFNTSFEKGMAENLTLNLTLPYIYVENGTVYVTHDINQLPEGQNHGDELKGIQARVVDNGLFDREPGEDAQTLYQGSLSLNGEMTLTPGNAEKVRLALSFYGSGIPENATVSVLSGGAYQYYITDQNAKCEINFTLNPGQGDNSVFNLINSNLQWEAHIQQVGEQPMWDKYNYMTYEIMIENKSEDESSYFDNFDLNFKFPSYSTDDYGIVDDDIMRWIVNDDGTITENPSPEDFGNYSYTGKAGEGGVLIYDVTDLDPEALSRWDLNEYSNVAEPSLPYHFTADRTINVEVGKPEGTLKKGETRSYYVAVPIQNNFPGQLNYTFSMDFVPTIFFGNNIAWSKNQTVISHFAVPNPQFTHRKYVLDDSGNPADTARAGVGELVSYYLDSFNNTGNVPIFDAVATDTLPEDFLLEQLRIELDADPQDPSRIPELSDWFNVDQTVDFEISDSDDNLSYISLGAFVSSSPMNNGQTQAWTLDYKTAAETYLKNHPDVTLTGNFEIHFTEKIKAGETFPGRIAVSGRTRLVQSYVNKINTRYAAHYYVPQTTTSGEQYVTVEKTVEEDEAAFNTQPGVPQIEARSFQPDAADSTLSEYSGVNTQDTKPADIQGLTAPNKAYGTGYDFEVFNASQSSTGDTEIWVDMTQSLSYKVPCADAAGCALALKGFKTSSAEIGNADKAGALTAVDFYDWNQNPAQDTPKATVAAADLPVNAEGRIVFDSQFLADHHIEALGNMVLRFSNFYGQEVSAPEKMNIRITGVTDGFDELDAVLTFKPMSESMKEQIVSATGRLIVQRPGFTLHTHIDYYENTPEVSQPGAGNTDGDETRLAIPYDRDYKFQVIARNETISVLDDTDLDIVLPIRDGSSTDEAYTGFHATKLQFHEDLFLQYAELKGFTLYDRDDLTGGRFFRYDADTRSFVSEDAAISADQNLFTITEAQLQSWGIPHLARILITGSGVQTQALAGTETWADIYGYSDSLFGTGDQIQAVGDNYLDHFRTEEYRIQARDTSTAFVSKMYFDTVVNAVYVDNSASANRFEQQSTAVEDVRNYCQGVSSGGTCYSFNDDSELDIGYKAIGSYTVDFRQYLNAGRNLPVDPNPSAGGSGNYATQEHAGMPYVYTQSFNTAADITMTLELPADHFEAYYLKVHPRVKDYLDSIEIVRQDGQRYTISASEWAANGVEQDAEGNAFFRINLLNNSDDLFSTVTPAGDENGIYYRAPESYAAANPVTRVIFSVKINQNVSDDGLQARNPDFGTEYNPKDQASRYNFEVTGRFYELGKAEAKVTTSIQAGGGRSKSRTDTGSDSHARSDWSYYNTYTYYTSWNRPATAEYDARGLVSSARAYVRNDSNLVLKGVHSNPNQDYDLQVKYGTRQEFAVGFYRTSAQRDHDYLGGSQPAWRNQDLDDWKAKISFADRVILEDTLPKIRKDKDSEYVGYLTTDITLRSSILKYLDYVEIITQTVTGNTSSAAGVPNLLSPIRLTPDQLPAADAAGDVKLTFKYAEKGETASADEILLDADDYVYSFKAVLKNIPGSADYARELENDSQRKTADFHGSSTEPDVKVGGLVYLIRDRDTTANATNKMTSAYQQDGKAALAQNQDTAYMLGYRVPFEGGVQIFGLDSANAYDYEAHDNMTPASARYGIRIWNRPDGGASDTNQSATIKAVDISSTMSNGGTSTAYYTGRYGTFNLKNIYIPKAFVDGGWFRIKNLTVRYGNNLSYTFSKADAAYFTLIEQAGQQVYQLDIEAFIHDHVDQFPTFTVTNEGAGKIYVREYISSFDFKLEAVSPDPEKTSSILAAGQYLSVFNDSASPYFHTALTYDGVWVDRTQDDVLNKTYSADSRPTFNMYPNNYDTSSRNKDGYNTLGYKFYAADLNAQSWGGLVSGSTTSYTYNLYNLVGLMDVNMERKILLSTSAGNVPTFAYDKEAKGTDNELIPVDRDHIVPYDILEYRLRLSASAASKIPLQHLDGRFTVPQGQRIIGWKLAESTLTKVADDKITASAAEIDATGQLMTPVTLDEGQLYLIDQGAETNYKELNVSFGDQPDTDADQVLPQEVVEIIVYTQMTDKMGYDPDTGHPNFAGKTTGNAVFYAAAQRKHTYSQYAINRSRNNSSYSEVGTYLTQNDDYNNNTYSRTFADFYREGSQKTVFTSNVVSTTQFMDLKGLYIQYDYGNTVKHFDGEAMTLKITGQDKDGKSVNLTNEMNHDLETQTFEVSFLSERTAAGKTELFKGFELGVKPDFSDTSKFRNPSETNTPIKAEYAFFTEDGKLEWLDETLVDEAVVTLALDHRPLADAVGIRWTYTDVPDSDPATGSPIVFATTADPIVFTGTGLYHDIRTEEEKQSQAIQDVYKMRVRGYTYPMHGHAEVTEVAGTAETFEKEVNYDRQDEIQKTIIRERPVLTFQTQIFSSEAEASAAYADSAVQKTGYRPEDRMWFKSTVINNPVTDPAQADKQMQGRLENPVLYDKVPEYVSAFFEQGGTLDSSQLHVRWVTTDDAGNRVERSRGTDYDIRITAETVTDHDYGGDMTITQSQKKIGLAQNAAEKDFTDVIPDASNSTEIQYTVYKIELLPGSDPDASNTLEIGDTLEIWYEVQARAENLPMVYSNKNPDLSNPALDNIAPEYFPAIGEYGHRYFGYSNSYGYTRGESYPLASQVTRTAYNGSELKVQNADRLMDMDYLIHDVGVSGTLYSGIDKWEFLKDSTVYMPGSGSDSVDWTGLTIEGGNNILMDNDMAVDHPYQATTYVPAFDAGKLDQLPSRVEYRSKSSAPKNRDIYKLLYAKRTAAEKNWDRVSEEADRIPVIWSSARTHLQKAWLAVSSEMIGTQGTDYNTQYLGNAFTKIYGWLQSDPRYQVYYSTYSSDQNNFNSFHSLLADDSITALEYNEDFQSRISAYNYGDWGLDGVEFTYIMPRGIQPQLKDDGTADLDAIQVRILSGGDSRTPSYTPVAASAIKAEVLQSPGQDQGYRSAQTLKDPLWGISGNQINTTSDDYGKTPYYTADEDVPWVLRITVDVPLKQWFGRGADSGYIVQAEIPSHVAFTNDSEYWYDQVFVKAKETENSRYHQIYDISDWRGSTLDKFYHPTYGALSSQYGGMDYLWNAYNTTGSADLDGTMFGMSLYGSSTPNMPYINGVNIQNLEVNSASSGAAKVMGTRDRYAAGKNTDYAATGTRAQMRRPFIRTWATVGEPGVNDGDARSYYFNGEEETSTLNLHVENHYWLDTLALNYYNSSTTGSYSLMKHLHSYAADGGSRGTLFEPVVTNILPSQLIPLASDGTLYSTDNSENAGKSLNWRLLDSHDAEITGDEKNIYDYRVQAVELAREDGGTETRFMVQFFVKPELPAQEKLKAAIISEDSRIFQFDFYVSDQPDVINRDGERNEDLLAQYQLNNTWVSSSIENFRFLDDGDPAVLSGGKKVTQNPYYVGAPFWTYYGNGYAPINDTRRDAVESYSGSTRLGGVISNDKVTNSLGSFPILEDSSRGGNRRYSETDAVNLEDFSTERWTLTLPQAVVDGFNNNAVAENTGVDGVQHIDQGVHSAVRLRTKHPSVTSEIHVSSQADDVSLGLRDQETTPQIEHYPAVAYDPQGQEILPNDWSDEAGMLKQHRQYGDILWYTASVENGAGAKEYSRQGDILHSKISVSFLLPAGVSYRAADNDRWRLGVEDDTGTVIWLPWNLDQPKTASGWEVEEVRRVIDPQTKLETVSFDITAPGERDVTAEKLYNGVSFAGRFNSGDKIVLKIKTIIDDLGEPDSVSTGNLYWDDGFQAQVFAAFHETDGRYLNNPDGVNLRKQDLSLTHYVREVSDEIDPASGDILVDYDQDGLADEQYASDTSARVTVLKPSAEVRADTGIHRIRLSNPDAMVTLAEDASVKSATQMPMVIDIAENTGGAAGEFIVNYNVPFRGTSKGTVDYAPAGSSEVESYIEKIRTGSWLIPDTYAGGDPDKKQALADHLRVYLYGYVSEHPAAEYDAGYPLVNDSYTQAPWVVIGDPAGYALDANHEITAQDAEGAALKDNYGKLLQIRYVIKAENEDACRLYPVPHGFRLATEMTDGSGPIVDPDTGIPYKNLDEKDPMRDNVEDLPQGIADNAAVITFTTSNTNGFDMKRHVNHFVSIHSRYDDDSYAPVIESEARGGFFVSAEYPYIQVDLIPYYFKRSRENIDGQTTTVYRWTDSDLLIQPGFSTMMKYRLSIRNLSNEELIDLGYDNAAKTLADNTSLPQLSLVTPFIQKLDASKLTYIPYRDESADVEYSKNGYIDTSYTSGSSLDLSSPQWTWYVSDNDGAAISEDYQRQLAMNDLRIYDKHADLYDHLHKIVTWDFDGKLRPGETLNIEIMIPLDSSSQGILTQSLLEAKGFAFKKGGFSPYIPSTDSASSTYGFELDKRDVNDNGNTSNESALTKTVGGLMFESTSAFNRLKSVITEYGIGINGTSGDVPGLVPEGTSYTFNTTILNPGQPGDTSYSTPVIYDVLPYYGDKNIVNVDTVTGLPLDRNSMWRGWLDPESLRVIETQAPASGGIVTHDLQLDVNYKAWLGPLKKTGGQITIQDVGSLPVYDDTRSHAFYEEMFKDTAKRAEYFVELKDVLALKASDPELYEQVSKAVQAIWVQVETNSDGSEFELGGQTKVEMKYAMKAPLNSDQAMGVDAANTANTDLLNQMKDFLSWNTFATTAIKNYNQVLESSRAGVYLAAPQERGYLGSYVWLDSSFDGSFLDEGSYERKDGGRWVLKNPTVDLDGDGMPDDPGISGVLVELLSENGYPVNKEGEAVVLNPNPDPTQAGGQYLLIDEATGNIKKDEYDIPEYSAFGAMASYVTEKDIADHNGYFMFSNLKPGKYKLRYTFPEDSFTEYSLTTLKIGDPEHPEKQAAMDIYRDGDTLPDLGAPGQGEVECDGQTIQNRLVVQTRDAIEVAAIGSDPAAYAAYDRQMASYNVGVYKSYFYGGYAWLDETQDPADPDGTLSDGRMDAAEQKLENVKVQLYEYSEGQWIPALDADGFAAEAVTKADGYYQFRVIPGKQYRIQADTAAASLVLKPSPQRIHDDPLAEAADNDLMLSPDAVNMTHPFIVDPAYTGTETKEPGVNPDTYFGIYRTIDLGFVEAGKGYLGQRVWSDDNYDGVFNRYDEPDKASETNLAGITMTLEQYYLDPASESWVNLNKDKTITTTETGYLFQGLKTYMADPADPAKKVLMGYKVRLHLDTIPDQYVITKYQQNSGAADNDLPASTTDGYLTAYDADQLLDGCMIIASPVKPTTLPANILTVGGKDYDLSEGQMILDLDAGLKPLKGGTLSGTIFADANYNGLFDPDEEGIAQASLGIRQYYLDADQHWQKVDAWDPADPSHQTLSGAQGGYLFEDLPSHVEIDGKYYLAGYQLEVDETSEPQKDEYALTRYQTASDTLRNSHLTEDYQLQKAEEYFIPAGILGENETTEAIYTAAADGVRYDMMTHREITEIDGGFVPYPESEITGQVFFDDNYSGLWDAQENFDEIKKKLDETGETIEVTLKQFYLKDGVWTEALDEHGQPVIQKTTVDEHGHYEFKHVPTQITVQDKQVLAGYHLMVAQLPQDFALAGYLVNGGDHDSSLIHHEDAYQITKSHLGYSGRLAEEKDGYLIAAYHNRPQDAVNAPTVREGYDLAASRSLTQYNMGLVSLGTAAISGRVFEDQNRDGIQNPEETGIENLKITVEQYARINDQWEPVMIPSDLSDPDDPDAGVMPIVSDGDEDQDTPPSPDHNPDLKPAPDTDNPDGGTQPDENPDDSQNPGTAPTERIKTYAGYSDAEGYYKVEDLPLFFEKNGQKILYGYRVQAERLPEGYGVSHYQTNQKDHDSDLNDKTGTLIENEEFMILAAAADERTDPEFVLDGYALIQNADVENLDAGLVPFPTASIEGIVFHDANEDGLYIPQEDGLAERTVYLERRTQPLDQEVNQIPGTTNVVEDGVYESTGLSAETDDRGHFRFENLPVINIEKNEAYVYRLTMDKAAGERYTLVGVPLETADGEILSNIYGGPLNAALANSASATEAERGITAGFAIFDETADENYYGLTYDPKQIQDRDDLALGLCRDHSSVFSNLPVNTSDSSAAAAAVLILLGAGAALFAVNRKKKREE